LSAAFSVCCFTIKRKQRGRGRDVGKKGRKREKERDKQKKDMFSRVSLSRL
jgi:hypothetical protein